MQSCPSSDTISEVGPINLGGLLTNLKILQGFRSKFDTVSFQTRKLVLVRLRCKADATRLIAKAL